MHAEDTYLFKHALLRDAAYNLQLPADRAALHLLAADELEALCSGPSSPLELVAYAGAIADHLHFAREHVQAPGLADREYRVLVIAARQADRDYRHEESERLWSRAGELCHGDDRVEALRRAGIAASRGGASARSEKALEAALEEARKTGNRLSLAAVLNNQSILWRFTGEIDRALSANAEARQLLEDDDDASLLASVYSSFASIQLHLGKLRQADELFSTVSRYHGRTDDELGAARCMGERAGVLRQLGRMDEARDLFERSIAVSRNHQSDDVTGRLLCNFGILYRELGQPDRARQVYREALPLLVRCGDRRSEGILYELMGTLHLDAEETVEAEELYRRALAVHREVGNRRSAGVCLGNLATLLAKSNRVPDALRMFQQALTIHREVRNPVAEGGHLCGLALCQLEHVSRKAAEETWEAGVETLRSIGATVVLDQSVAEMQESCSRLGVEPLRVPDPATSKRP